MQIDRFNDAGGSPTSGVEQLLVADLPFSGRFNAAGKLLSISATAFSRDQLALAWQQHSSRQTEAVLWSSEQSAQEFELSGQDRLSDLIVISGWLPSELRGLHWQRLPTTSDQELFLGDDPESTEIPDEWKLAIARLFAWALQSDQILRDQKLSALVEYAAGAGHEINNPLGSIIGRTSQLLKLESDPEKRRMLETIGAQAYRIGDMIGDTILFAAPPPSSRKPLDLREIVAATLSKFQAEILNCSIQLDQVEGNGSRVFADPVHLQIVIAELLRNALRALSEIPPEMLRTMKIRCSAANRSGRTGGFLEVYDNGPGLTPEQVEHCFDPFYSGRQAGRGLGFGLSKCWRIVQQHAGEISIHRENHVTCVRVWIPSNECSGV